MKAPFSLCLVLLIAAWAACTPKSQQHAATTSLDTPQTVDTTALAPAPEVLVAPPAQGLAWVVGTALVRREPSDAKEVAGPGKRGKRANWMATLYRGEQVRVLKDQTDWFEVRLSDERVGWLKADNLLFGDGLREATVLSRCRSFTRPDLLALNNARPIEPGTLLFVVRDKDQFSEVNVGGRQLAWVLSGWLVGDAQEVDAAKLIHRARLLQERKDPSAAAVIDLARSHFGQTRLMQALMAAQTPAAPPTDGEAPTDGVPENQDLQAPQQRAAPVGLQLTPDATRPPDAQAPGGAPGLQNLYVAPAQPAPMPEPTAPDDSGQPDVFAP